MDFFYQQLLATSRVIFELNPLGIFVSGVFLTKRTAAVRSVFKNTKMSIAHVCPTCLEQLGTFIGEHTAGLHILSKRQVRSLNCFSMQINNKKV